MECDLNTDVCSIDNYVYLDEYTKIYTRLLKEATGKDTIYTKTLEYISEEFKSYNIKNRDKAQLVAGLMAKLTNVLTVNAMQQAQIMTDRQFKLKYELGSLCAKTEKDKFDAKVACATLDTKIELSQAQTKKTINEADFINEQRVQLIKGVLYNNKIKAMDSMGDMFGTLGAGGLAPTKEMWDTYFTLNRDLVYSVKRNFLGEWDPSTNTPSICNANGVGNTIVTVNGEDIEVQEGDFFIASTDGSTLVDGTNNWKAGDTVAFDGYIWRADGVIPVDTTITPVE
jgi:phenylalanyl-tRNA synthetase alpha subunit